MGFCRHCGDIVTSDRCRKCGGLAVAPSVKFEPKKDSVADRWSKTYVSSSHSVDNDAKPSPSSVGQRPTSQQGDRFPRPQNSSSTSSSYHRNRVSAHIASVTTSTISASSPTSKNQIQATEDPSADGTTIVKSHVTGSLVKVYGTILQRPESLATFACAECSTVFGPDETIYPSPSISDIFLCADCFKVAPGASRGQCDACRKPVFGLVKSEGGLPVQNGGRIWHAKCFVCMGCGDKSIAKSPMVDILGRPCCESCFDKCLEMGEPSPQRKKTSSSPERQGSPVVEELAQRLGIKPSPRRVSKELSPVRPIGLSPAVERLAKRLNDILAASAADSEDSGPESPARPPSRSKSPTRSPTRGSTTATPTRPFLLPSRKASASVSSSQSAASLSSFDSSDADASTVSTALTSPADSPPPDPHKRYGTRGSNPVTPVKTPQSTTRASLIPVRSTGKLGSSTGRPSSGVYEANSSSAVGGTKPMWNTPSTFLNPAQGALPASIHTKVLNSSNPQARTPSIATGKGSSFSTPTPSPQSSNQLPQTPSTIRRKPSRSSLTTPRSSLPHGSPVPLPTPSEMCIVCTRPLLAPETSGRVVTVPSDVSESGFERYHDQCFTCARCGDAFGELDGKTNFVREEGQVVHVSCASPLRVVRTNFPIPSVYPNQNSFKKVPAPVFDLEPPEPSRARSRTLSSARTNLPATSSLASSSPKLTPIPSSTVTSQASASSNGRYVCPGCSNTVFQMEKGIVPGPGGSKWHAACLVCGGKEWKVKRAKDRSVPGCGKKLDSQAKGDTSGAMWCRDCLLLLPDTLRGPPSPNRVTTAAPHQIAMDTGGAGAGTYGRLKGLAAHADVSASSSSGRISSLARHYTGGSTNRPLSTLSHYSSGGGSPIFPPLSPLATDFTGGGGGRSVSPVRRQMTGTSAGGYGRTSPIKTHVTGGVRTHVTGGATGPLAPQVTGGGLPVTRPRPKSVLGTRAAGTKDRGMELVRQMTGGGGL